MCCSIGKNGLGCFVTSLLLVGMCLRQLVSHLFWNLYQIEEMLNKKLSSWWWRNNCNKFPSQQIKASSLVFHYGHIARKCRSCVLQCYGCVRFGCVKSQCWQGNRQWLTVQVSRVNCQNSRWPMRMEFPPFERYYVLYYYTITSISLGSSKINVPNLPWLQLQLV